MSEYIVCQGEDHSKKVIDLFRFQEPSSMHGISLVQTLVNFMVFFQSCASTSDAERNDMVYMLRAPCAVH